jgi:hypothetical protein
VTLLTRVPEELFGRGIEPSREAHNFSIVLDTAQPWGGGVIEGRVELHAGGESRRPLSISVTCAASWLDIAPELVGQKPLLRPSTYWSLRTRGIPIWLDEIAWRELRELGSLDTVNWLRFAFQLPAELPRAFEGTFVSFRYRVTARRRRPIGSETASLPLILFEQRVLPVIRVETSPIGSWRLLEHRSEEERDGAAGPCSVRYEERSDAAG